ncbi:MAG: radical SAM protein [Elusimicrobiota bacterium]
MKTSISEKLFEVSRRKKIPLIVNFEVTHRCNLDCVHCYHSSASVRIREELKTSEIETLLESLKETGTMFLVFTGGEPFLREDIGRLLNTAKNLGFSVIIFTNGTLIDDKTAEMIADIVPFSVQLSVYSARKDIHDGIVRKKGAFEKTIKAAALLRNKGVNVLLKTPVMKENLRGLEELKNWAESEGYRIKIDPFISPCDANNAVEITRHRIPVGAINELVAEKSLFDPGNFRPRTLLECPAGMNTAALDAGGDVFPCIVWRKSAGNIRQEEFAAIWGRMDPCYDVISDCSGCENLQFCGVCPGVAGIEGRDIFCQMADNVRKIIEGRR